MYTTFCEPGGRFPAGNNVYKYLMAGSRCVWAFAVLQLLKIIIFSGTNHQITNQKKSPSPKLFKITKSPIFSGTHHQNTNNKNNSPPIFTMLANKYNFTLLGTKSQKLYGQNHQINSTFGGKSLSAHLLEITKWPNFLVKITKWPAYFGLNDMTNHLRDLPPPLYIFLTVTPFIAYIYRYLYAFVMYISLNLLTASGQLRCMCNGLYSLATRLGAKSSNTHSTFSPDTKYVYNYSPREVFHGVHKVWCTSNYKPSKEGL